VLCARFLRTVSVAAVVLSIAAAGFLNCSTDATAVLVWCTSLQTMPLDRLNGAK